MKKIHLILLLLIILGAIATRLYQFDNPIADWHAWRQADTSAVSQNFVKNGFDLLHPRYSDISNIQSGMDNPNGYRFVEFPIYNTFQAGLYKTFGNLSLVQWGRIVTIISSILSLIFIFLLVRKYANTTAAFFSAAFYAFLPFNIYYGRSILPDPMMIMASLGGIYFFDKWLSYHPDPANAGEGSKNKQKSNWIWFSLSVILTASALLLKPYAIFFTLPMIYLIFYKLGLKFYKKWSLYLYLIIAITPLILWRIWMTQFPEGIPANDWLFNGGDIRFKGAFFYWIFADRIGRLILGYWGLVILGFGLLFLGTKKHLSKNLFLFSFFISSLLYITIIARGNVQHDYYQILIIPSIAILLGLGSSYLLNLSKEHYHKSIGYLILVPCALFALFFSWYHVRDYFNINNPSIVSAGAAVDKLTPKDSKVIAILHGSEGDTTFLYQTNRQGWPSFQNDLPEMIKMGADYLIFANPQEDDNKYSKEYKLVESTNDYIIFDLRQTK